METGSLYLLAKQNVSSVVVIKDSNKTPKTLPASQYQLNSKHGHLLINNITTYSYCIELFKANYAYGAVQSIAMFTYPLPERWIYFKGLNTADSNREVFITSIEWLST
ncbi:hypothetical protein [Candidatus Williamhamiltonella defendens]|uniref:hypothetical protein n=1 Tax=Candidatus Williamhamiltonella defendens TaxID=138072 RepID=UPI001F38AB3F|nr:hypothetical protein [Candidatus Hamiltonella defensa]